MSNAFVLRSDERGYDRILSTGPTASYVGGHPDAFITRFSSFNFGNYQDGRHGFGKIRVFGDEAFYHPGCSYNMHPHPQDSPHFLQQGEERFEHGESADELGVFRHQRCQSMGRHVGDQVVEHRPLAEQRVGAALGGV